jgi:hypothetical protein
MFDTPLDAWYVWLGVGMVSVAVTGTALALPTVAPPSAAPVADAIDRVGSSPNQAYATVDIVADRIRLSPRSIALDTGGGTARARLAFGPVTPVGSGALRQVLSGHSPDSVFASKQTFETVLRRTRRADSGWRESPGTLTVRRVSWGGVNATLVG